MGKKKRPKNKIRTDFRKNRGQRTRRTSWTRDFERDGLETEDPLHREAISGKGDLSRRRTVIGNQVDQGDEPGFDVLLNVDRLCRPGRVLSVHGLFSKVQDTEGTVYQCATRRLLNPLLRLPSVYTLPRQARA